MFIVLFIHCKLCENHGVAEKLQCVLDSGGFLEHGCGCVASSALHGLMMSCGFIFQVVVVTCIANSVEFV